MRGSFLVLGVNWSLLAPPGWGKLSLVASVPGGELKVPCCGAGSSLKGGLPPQL